MDIEKFIKNVKIIIAINIGAVIAGLIFGIWLVLKILGI